MNAARRPQGNEDSQEPFIPDFSEGAETGLYLALLELLDEGLIITGDELILDANSAACRLLERDYRQIAGKPLADLFPTERDFLDARARLFIQGETRGNLRVALPGDRQRDLRFVAAARIRPGIHALILSPDIAVEATVDTPQTDTLWPRLAAALEQPVIVVDDWGKVAAANAPALAVLGLSRANLMGKPIESCVAIEWPASGATPIAHLRTRTRPDAVPARVLPGPKPDWRLLVLPPASRSDATPNTLPESRAANTSSGLLERVFARSPLPTLLCEGPNLSIFAANEAAAKVYGYPPETLCTMGVADLRTGHNDGRAVAESGVWQYRHADGNTFDADVLTYPIDSDEHPGAYVLMHDLPDTPLLTFESKLRQALDLAQLEVYFQPLIDTRDGSVRGGEALLRWNHPEIGLLPFRRFMNVARDVGLLHQMSDWVLHAACRHASQWPKTDKKGRRVTINVTIEQIMQGDLAERVRDALSSSGLAANQLELDLDELVLKDENARVLTDLLTLHEMGVHLAIDDFGRGLASIPKLKRYPLRALKLDNALVREVGVREDSEAIVEAISSMAGVLGLEVFARGVEGEAQQAFLSALGCHLQQGPLFGRPMSATEFGEYLATPR